MSRINRTQFAIRFIISTFILLVVFFIVTSLNYGFNKASGIILLFLVLIQGAYLIPSVIKRSRDSGTNAFLGILLFLIPLVNLFFLYHLLFTPSTEESKKILEEEKKLKEQKDYELFKKQKRWKVFENIFEIVIVVIVVVICIWNWDSISNYLDNM